jgi:hypothetical protein
VSREAGDPYSEVTDLQFDELEAGDNVDLYNSVLTICEFILNSPEQAQAMSTAIRTNEGIRFRLPVPGYWPCKIFWSSNGPRIEAMFPHP